MKIFVLYFFAIMGWTQDNTCDIAIQNLDSAVACVSQSNYKEALKTIYISKKNYKNCTPEIKAAILHELAIIHMYTGNKDSTIYYSKKVLDFARKNKNDSLKIKSLTNLGMLLNQINQPKKALKHYREVWNYYHKKYDHNNLSNKALKKALSSSNMALTYYNLKKLDSAVWYIENSLEWTEKSNNSGFKVYNYNLASGIYEANNENAKALALTNASLQISKANRDTKQQVLALSRLLKYAMARNNKERCIEILTEISEIQTDNLEPWVKNILKEQRIAYFEFIGDYKKANDLIKREVQIQDSLKQQDLLIKINELNTEYNTLKIEKELLDARLIIESKERNNYLLLFVLSILLGAIALIYNQLSHKKKQIQIYAAHQKDFNRFFNYIKNQEQTVSTSNENKIFNALLNLFKKEKSYLDSNLKAADLARLLGTNSKYLSTAVNEVYGNSISHFINRYRIEEAKHIIKSNYLQKIDKNLNEIWDSCGFNSNVHFYRTFKAITGLTPAEYQKSIIDESKMMGD